MRRVHGILVQSVRDLKLPVLVIASLAGFAACGSAGKAQPTEVEISWPDAALANSATNANASVQDAGIEQTTADAQSGERVR